MKKLILSAGLLYLYLNGYEEDGVLYMQQTNTYNHIENGFYQQLMEVVKSADEDERIVHIFAVIGIKEKANKVYSLMEDELQSNYQRILSKKESRKSLWNWTQQEMLLIDASRSFSVNSQAIFLSVFIRITVILS